MQKPTKTRNILVVGMGSFAFGLEKRTVTMLKHMRHVRPYFLISKYTDGSPERLLERHGFEYKRVPLGYLGKSKPIWTLITLSQIPWLYYKFLSAYLRKGCDTILMVSIHDLLNAFLPIILLRFLGRATIVYYLGDIPRGNRRHLASGRIINRLTDRVIANSDAVKRALVRTGVHEDNIQVVYNGLDLNKFANRRGTQFCRRFSWPAQSLLVGYVGQFSQEQKGLWDFVRAAESVLNRTDKCRFLMIGKTVGEDLCEQEIVQYVGSKGLGDHIVFAGWIDDIEEAYASLDVLVVPSRVVDSAPNVSIEAMASGVPVVATRVGGIPELVVDGGTGFLVEEGQTETMAERILQLAHDPELRQRMGRAGCERAHRMFDIRKNACLVEEILLNG